MGQSTSSLIHHKKPLIMISGESASGKTTFLYKAKMGLEETVNSIPTIGFNVEDIQWHKRVFVTNKAALKNLQYTAAAAAEEAHKNAAAAVAAGSEATTSSARPTAPVQTKPEILATENIEFITSPTMTFYDVGDRSPYRSITLGMLKGLQPDVMVLFIDATFMHEKEWAERQVDLLRLIASSKTPGNEGAAQRPLLILCNKYDLPNAMPISQIAALLPLSEIESPIWTILPVSCLTGQGLPEAMEWLVDIAFRKSHSNQKDSEKPSLLSFLWK